MRLSQLIDYFPPPLVRRFSFTCFVLSSFRFHLSISSSACLILENIFLWNVRKYKKPSIKNKTEVSKWSASERYDRISGNTSFRLLLQRFLPKCQYVLQHEWMKETLLISVKVISIFMILIDITSWFDIDICVIHMLDMIWYLCLWFYRKIVVMPWLIVF